MNLRIAIVDDMDDDRHRLSEDVRALLKRKQYDCDIVTYTRAEEFLDDPERGKLDIAFLDVRMDGMDGIQLATRLRDGDTSLVIVFVTSSREYALDAFPTHPFDYLVKPYTRERLATVLNDILASLRMRSERKIIQVAVPYGNMSIPLDRVVIVEARSHSSMLTLEGGQELRSTMSFAQVYGLVSEEPQFLLVNRGVLINMDHVESVEGASVVMEGGLRLPLRKRDRSELGRTIAQHMITRTGRR